jgi:E3 ubiquitin-protein ligase MYCBP2
MRDDWEVSLCSGAPAPVATDDLIGMPDTYCFEMLSLVLALSGSSVGRSYLASQFGLIVDLLTLLHTGNRSAMLTLIYEGCHCIREIISEHVLL